MKERLVVIVGPTAVGKTKLSIDLAQRFRGEILSGDSMQVYKGMDIGTAKVTPEETEGIPHHLIDILDPTEEYSVSRFQAEATSIISELNGKGILPFLVGGTGLYVQAVTHQFQLDQIPESKTVRNKWESYVDRYGQEALYEQLQRKDPHYASRLHPNNTRRVIRALEVLELSGKSMAAFQQDWNKPSPYDLFMIGLTMDREKLYERIHLRVDQMIEEGLIEETERLLQQGVTEDHTSMQAIGYKEIVQYLIGNLSQDEAIQLLKKNTRRFAKRQLTWFRRMSGIHWYDLTEMNYSQLLKKIAQDMEGEWRGLENI